MKSVLAVLAAVAVTLGGVMLLAPAATAEGATPAVAARLTPAQAEVCERLRDRVRTRTARIQKLRRLDASQARVRRVRESRRGLVGRMRLACHPTPRHVVDGVVIFGDSLTVNATATIDSLFPDWEIDAQWGRGVTALPQRIATWKHDYAFAPQVVVFALGTNEQADWDKGDYIAAADMLEPGTRLVLVNTWRPNAGVGTPEDGSRYSAWMDEIAAERPRTTVADWRGAASAQPSLTYDGLHQTTPEGVTVWTGLVGDAVDRVLAMP